MDPIDLFYSYAHEDELLRDELAGHLKIMERRGVLRSWHDRSITAGQEWEGQIDEHLASADLVLLLVSADFINSDYIWGHELEIAMQRHQRGEASVVPVLLRAVLIDGAPFADLQGLPTDLRPVTSWPNRDEAWTNVAKGIRGTVDALRARRAASTPAFTSPEQVGTAPPGAAPTRGQKPPTQADPLLERVVREYANQVEAAAWARGATGIDREGAERTALSLIDTPDPKRVLWVDDLPSGNHLEAAALAKLQIEMVQVTSTEAARAKIARDDERFDLVISDWSRPEPTLGAPCAGIRLLRELRAGGWNIPVIFYHGEFESSARQARHQLAMAEGAFGEAVLPDELLCLAAAALDTQ